MRSISVFVVMPMLVLASAAQAQWRTQQIELDPGWNAVYLEVQPEPADTDVLFAGLPVESVWAWNREFSSVEFIQDASTLVPNQEGWLHYSPDPSDPGFVTSLFSLRAGHAYLIEVNASQPVQWNVTGKAVARPLDWLPDSYNLVGFPVDPANAPTFASYLAPSAALSGSSIFRMNASGEWAQVADLAAETIVPGEAYWVYCDGSTTYPGPVSVELEQAGSLDFGRTVHDQLVRVRNETYATKQVTLRPVASAPPPAGTEHPLAGPVALSYWEQPGAEWTGGDDPGLRWIDFTDPFVLSVPPRGSAALRVAVRRPDMGTPATPEARFQSVLEVVDGDGSLLTLPVLSRGLDSISTSGGSGGAAAQAADARAGLWVGTATLDHVGWASSPTDKTTPRPTSSEMQIRIIMHVDANGQARLLQSVTLMWEPGTRELAPDGSGTTVVAEPGRYVLVTRDELLDQCEGAAMRDGTLVGRRISSAAFSFSEPLAMTGSFGGSLATGPIPIAFDDPLNPFRHRYHADHDNLDYDFETALPEGRESYDVVREIDFAFEQDDPDGVQLAGWGDTVMGGSYAESITGLHKETLHVVGDFRLHQASRIPALDDGCER